MGMGILQPGSVSATIGTSGVVFAATADPLSGPTPTRPTPAPATRETDPDRLLREFKKTLGHDS